MANIVFTNDALTVAETAPYMEETLRGERLQNMGKRLWIKLTRTSGDPVYVNVDRISYFE